MNSSANLQIFLEAPPASSVEAKKPQPQSRPENKQAFAQHLKGNLEQPADRKPRDKSKSEKNSGTEQKLEVRRAEPERRPERKEVAKAVSDGKDLPVSGEKLPLPEETREFLASLTADQRSDFLEELQAWLKGLSDEDFVELQKALLDGDLVSLQELLPEELNDLLVELAEKLDIQLEDIHQEVQQLLASLQRADIDFRQLANMRFDNQSGELKVATESENRPRTPGYAAQRNDAENAVRGRDTVETGKESSQGRQERQDGRQEKQDGRLEALVARLGRGDVSTLSNRSGGESMQQLIHAASMGLGNTAAAQPAAARMAASMPTMSQAAAQAAVQANAAALANRISTLQTRGIQIAEMRLDPPDLGNLRVQIRMQGDQASVIFQSPNAHARDLLENALPRLKEMLEEQGLSLTDASVSEESYSEEGESESKEGAQGSGLAGEAELEGADNITYFDEPLGLIDYYA